MSRRWGERLAAVALLCAAALFPSNAWAERRVALVIGNAAYQNVSPLNTPVNDADRVAAVLRTLDFDVIEAKDLDKLGMELALRRFSAEINGADVALFYYSGHGAQVGDLNYLLPVSAKVDREQSLQLDTIALQDVNSLMRSAGAKVQLLFLDACRNNPFAAHLAPGRPAVATRGFAPVQVASGALVVFSAAPGQVAEDGGGEVSPFTEGFLRYAATPKLDVRQMLSRVRSFVANETDDRQLPWDNSSLLSDFYLVPKRPPPSFEKLMRVELGSGDSVQALQLQRPTQPEGGGIEVRIEKAPIHGQLFLNDRQMRDEDVMTAAEFASLGYKRNGPSPADSFSFRVTDAWGNDEVGLVSIAFDPQAAPTTSVQPAAAPVRKPSNISLSAISLVGFGPNLNFRGERPSHPGDASLIELAADPPFGQFVLGKRVIGKGRSIALADLTSLAYAPPVGSDGQAFEASFAYSDGSNSEVKVAVEIALADCDRLAGDRLDAQGVGKGVLPGEIDVAAALPACELAIATQPDSPRFNYELARVYAALGRNEEAASAYRKAADLGYVRALWALGYRAVYLPPTDFAKGMDLLQRAAASGDVFAFHTLGQIYYEGRGVPKNLDKARRLFETAARMGHTFSMNSLGRMYQRGETVPVDNGLARRFWEESAARGDVYGIDNLGYLYLDGVGVEKDPARALSYFKRAADLGHPEAPNNIGRMYLLGLGVPVSYAEARRWYALGVERRDAWAAFNLGELTRLGKGGPADDVQAGYFYARAAASLNRPEPAELARKQLAVFDPRKKLAVLRLLLRDVDASVDSMPDDGLVELARREMAKGGLTPADDSTDALLVGAAQAGWLSKNVRSDLF